MSATAAPAKTDARWRFRPSLEQSLPPGAVAEPVLELSEPRQIRALVLAAVLRPNAEHVEIERYSFEQNPDGESLRLLQDGEAMLRLRPGGTRHPELAEIRRRLAAPRVVLTRPVGLDVAEPGDLIERVSTALATMQDTAKDPRARVEAAATAVRGIDDALLLEHDAMGELAALIVPMPASTAVTRDSERRATLLVAADGRSMQLGAQRKSDGWVLVSMSPPRAAPKGD